MAEDFSNMSLIQKLAKIRKGTEVLQKDASGYGYKYVTIATVLSHVTAGMNKYGVSLIPRLSDTAKAEPFSYVKLKTTKSGERYEEPVTEYVASSLVTYTWVNNDNPEETIEIPWFITGSQSDPSQAMGSALTYGMRYFLCNYFQIATPESDPDEWRSKQKEAEEAEVKSIADKIIKEFDGIVRTFLADHEDKKDEVSKFVKRFVKSGDYTKITDPALAGKLLSDFNEKFINTKEEK